MGGTSRMSRHKIPSPVALFGNAGETSSTGRDPGAVGSESTPRDEGHRDRSESCGWYHGSDECPDGARHSSESPARSKTGASWSGGRRARFTMRSPEAAGCAGHGARILQINILWSDLNIEQSGLDVGMTHPLHERGKSWRRSGTSHGTAGRSGLQESLERSCSTTLNEEGVRIVAIRQRDTKSGYALLTQPDNIGLAPYLQAALTAWQEAMRWCRSGYPAAVEMVASQSFVASRTPRCSKRPAQRRTLDGSGDWDASATSVTDRSQVPSAGRSRS
jgi:hypothetical protein